MAEILSKNIDAFQRRKLRCAINIIWPRKIRNDKLYKITNVKPWGVTIEKRRLSWLGHLMRLDVDTPARKALNEALKYTPRKQGRPPATWIDVIQKDLKKRNINIILRDRDALSKLASIVNDKSHWKTISKLPEERITTVIKSS